MSSETAEPDDGIEHRPLRSLIERNKIVVHESFARGADKREVWEPRSDGRYLRRTYRWRESIDDWRETGSVVVEHIAIRDYDIDD